VCRDCRWAETVAAIEGNLRLRAIDQTAMILAKLADVIRDNQHVSDRQREAAEAEIERHAAVIS